MKKEPALGRTEPRQLARREFLVLSGAVLLLAGCESDGAVVPRVVAPRTAAVDATLFTVDDLLSTTPFRIAHRGSGDNWTEHTLSAYGGVLAAGARAIEVSVHMSADGVFVCHHDTNLLRMTGVDREIATVTYRELSQIKNDARSWLGPAAELQPIPALRDVLDQFAAKYVIFIEDKTGSHARELLNLLDSYPNSTNHFVWKQTAASEQFKLAKQRGYKVWGYFIDNKDGAFARYADRFDLLGIYHGATDDEIKEIVSYGAPVICWEIHTRWMRDRVLKLGVKGLMCSNYLYVSHNGAHALKDAFTTGLRAPGDLPWIISPKYQPTINAQDGAVRLDFDSSAAYQLGSVSPGRHAKYTLTFDMCWPELLPPDEKNAGISFGAADDQPYRPTVAGLVGGYHLIYRINGQVQLFRRDPGSDPGDPIGSFSSDPAVSGEWSTFKVEVSPTTIRYSRIGDPAWTAEVADGTYRGGYLALNKNYATPEPVEFRALNLAPA